MTRTLGSVGFVGLGLMGLPLARNLAAAGADFTNVVNMRVCLRDPSDFQQFNAAFTEFMQGEKVTRTCIGGTPHRAGVNVEIDCVAMFDEA